MKSLLDRALPFTSPDMTKSEIFPSQSPEQLPGFLSPLRKLFDLLPTEKNSSSKNILVIDIFLILPTHPSGVRCLEKAALLISRPTAQLQAVSTKMLCIRWLLFTLLLPYTPPTTHWPDLVVGQSLLSKYRRRGHEEG